jgi:hypothetical protein
MAKTHQAGLFSDDRRDAIEAEIKSKQREVKYDLRDFTIGYIVKEFRAGLFFIPPYQREFIWNPSRQYRFIESVLLGLPIPMMFIADLDDGRLEIVDGAQRIKTLESFMSDDLKLDKLERLPSLNGATFSDLPDSQKRKFGTKALRMVVLEDTTTLDTRQEIFDRINTSPMRARGAEIRRGTFAGAFATFITRRAADPLFRQLCPISPMLIARREDEELVLRFFAYSDRYLHFKHDVEKFLAAFIRDHRDKFDRERMQREFETMLEFVRRYFPYGFAKSGDAKATPRVRFEAISVGVNLALREKPDLVPEPVLAWLESEEFDEQVTTHASNSRPRLRRRVEFVRDRLLGVEEE